jgi:hypothetical protein
MNDLGQAMAQSFSALWATVAIIISEAYWSCKKSQPLLT